MTISASLGAPVLRLWGYGPSNSRVELRGNGVEDFTYARTDGYFEFSKAFLPSPIGLLYPELCLTGIDLIGRATPPTCIPALPANEFSYDIGPVILPPTLSLEAGTVSPSTQTGVSGITIPNSEVKIVLAEENTGRSLAIFSIVKTALAYYIPNYTVKSDSRGNFSFNMPDASPNNWRVFAITTYSQGSTSPKSNTLTFRVISPMLALLENIWKLILSLLNLRVLIVLEVLIILIIIITLFSSKRSKIKVSPNTSNPINEYQNYLRSKRLPRV